MKKFFQVFQELKGNEELELIFLSTEISRITLRPDRSKLTVYLHSDHLIQRADIRSMEDCIRKQVFSGKKIQISIRESFHLSSQYTAKILFQEYADSLMEELRERNIVIQQMFQKGRVEWEDDSALSLFLPEIALFQKEELECIRVIEKIFQERCGIPVQLRIRYDASLNKPEKEKKENSQIEEEPKPSESAIQSSTGKADEIGRASCRERV